MRAIEHHAACGRALSAALLAVGCVSTDLDTRAPPLPICSAGGATTDAERSVVLVTADLANAGLLRCSGVIIAPTLVLTSLSCIVLPDDTAPIDVVAPRDLASFAGTRDLEDGLVDYSTACDRDAGWTPRENGTFAARHGELVSVTSLAVSDEGALEEITTVRETLRSRSDSRCKDSLAILLLDVPLDGPSMSLRLEAPTRTDEAVTLIGFGGTGGEYRRHQLQSSVLASPTESGTGLVPPRSLLLRGGVCDFESGGAVVSEDTGALIAVIASNLGSGCGEAEGQTVALSIAPFQQMLVEAADRATESLRAEATAGGVRWPPCVAQ